MKITKIEAQVKTKGRYSVFVEDVFAFGISELGLIDSKIRVGVELTQQQLYELKDTAHVDKIYNMTLGLIARRARSQWEIKDYLRRKEVVSEAAEQIINRLIHKGYIDDIDFAVRWVENRRLLKPISKRKLEMELRQKRVADSAIKDALANDQANELDVLKTEVEKKRRISRYQDDTKLMRYLAGQGYGYDDIKTALAGGTG